MIIGYKKDLDGVLRAAVALKKNPDATMVCGANKQELKRKLSMYHGEIVMNVDEIIKDVPFRVKLELKVKLPSCNPMQRSPTLGAFLSNALRNAKCVPDELVRLLAGYYPNLSVILAQKDAGAKKYYRLQRETCGELERIKAYCRFRPSGDMLYVEVNPKNDIQDLIFEWAMRRNEGRVMVVKCHAEYYLLNARALGYRTEIAAVSKEEAERRLGDIPEVDGELWDTFYDSQNIENRRNKRYAKGRLPEKFSYISPEIRKERKKIEHGIQPDKLDDFFLS